MKNKTIALIIYMAIPLLVGLCSGLLTKDAMKTFNTLGKPPLAPPPVLFPIVWTILYLSMGLALFLALNKVQSTTDKAAIIVIFIAQLAINFFWSIFFFNLEWRLVAFIMLLALLILVISLASLYKRYSFLAFIMTVPYVLWLAFAGYLNVGIILLN